MSLPTKWVEKIFTKLTLAYGRDFLNRWEGIPIAQVKTDWAYCLTGFTEHPEAIMFALLNLPDSRPPTAQEFRALCRQAPRKATTQLPSPMVDPEVVDAEILKMAAAAMKPPVNERGQIDHKRWARKLQAAHSNGMQLSLVQVNAYKTALGLNA